jgi:DNA primase
MKWKYSRLEASEIKAAVDPVDFYLREQGIARFGYRSGKWAVAGLCPFHDDGSPGSFKINRETGAFKCFSCGEGGSDIIAFLQKRDGLAFVEALQSLASDWGCA